jgi:ankyrin repeat protein
MQEKKPFLKRMLEKIKIKKPNPEIQPSNKLSSPTKEQELLDYRLWDAALYHRNADVIRLIKKGADMTAKDSRGRTALHNAARNEDPRTCLLILCQCAKSGKSIKELMLIKDERGNTSSELAASYNHFKTAHSLKSIEWMISMAEGAFINAFNECVGS